MGNCKGRQRDRPLADAHQRQEPLHRPVSDPETFYRGTRPRPVKLYVPSTYDAQTPMALVVFLHGYGGGEENYMKFQSLAESRGFLHCYPDGISDAIGNPCWNAYFENATDSSAFQYPNVDDVASLRNLIQEIGRRLALDRKRFT